jgi:beta-lactamase class A
MADTPLVARRTLLGSGGALLLPLLGSAPSEAAGIETMAQLTTAIRRYLTGRVGTLGMYVYDARSRQAYGYNNFRSETLSTVKVLVLIALLRQCQETSRTMTASQQDLAGRMIIYSDNAATDTLIGQVGTATLQRVARDLYMTTSTIQGGSYGTSWWGYSMSTPLELLRMVMAVTYGNYLTYANRVYIQQLMAKVTATQRWGVCDPPLPWQVYTLTKNGWGPRTGGYRVNSVGYVNGNGRLYSMAILSRSPNGFTYGKDTVNAVSRIVYDALDKPLT